MLCKCFPKLAFQCVEQLCLGSFHSFHKPSPFNRLKRYSTCAKTIEKDVVPLQSSDKSASSHVVAKLPLTPQQLNPNNYVTIPKRPKSLSLSLSRFRPKRAMLLSSSSRLDALRLCQGCVALDPLCWPGLHEGHWTHTPPCLEGKLRRLFWIYFEDATSY